MVIVLLLSACQPTERDESDVQSTEVNTEENSISENQNMSEEAGQTLKDESGKADDIAKLQAELLNRLEIPAKVTVLKETELECPAPSERGGIITDRYDNGDGDKYAYQNEGRDRVLQKIAEFVPRDEQPWLYWEAANVPEEYIALYAYGENCNGVLQWGDRFLEMEESFGYNGGLILPKIWLEDVDGDWVDELCVKAMESSLVVYKKEGEDVVKYSLPLSRDIRKCYGVRMEEDGFLAYTHDSTYKIYAESMEYSMEHYRDEYGIDISEAYYHYEGNYYGTFMGFPCRVGETDSVYNSTPFIYLCGVLRLEDGVFIWDKLYWKPRH